MSKLAKEINKHFKQDNLYDFFHIPKGSDPQLIKKAYYKLSRQFHPDRSKDKDATTKFQIISKAYSILANDKSRTAYNKDGTILDDSVQSGVDDWNEFFRKEFNVDILDNFEKEYVGSDEEKDDIKGHYLKHEGNMDKITSDLFFYKGDSAHDERVRQIVSKLIKDKEVPAYDAFTKETDAKRAARKRRYEKEAKACAEHVRNSLAKMGEKPNENGEMDLVAMIRQRNEARAGDYKTMLNRIAGDAGGSGDAEKPDDEEDDGMEGNELGEGEDSDDDEDDESDEEGSGEDEDGEDQENQGSDDEDGGADEDDDDDDEEDGEEEVEAVNSGPAPKRARRI